MRQQLLLHANNRATANSNGEGSKTEPVRRHDLGRHSRSSLMTLYPFHIRRSLAPMSTGAHVDICAGLLPQPLSQPPPNMLRRIHASLFIQRG
jgi:hypothetical protein